MERLQDNSEDSKEKNLDSENPTIRWMLKELGSEKVTEIVNFAEDKKQEFAYTSTFDNIDEAKNFFDNYAKDFNENHNYNDLETISYYRGLGYKYINSVERGVWNYDELGRKTNESENKIRSESAALSDIIKTSPRLSENIIVFRGSNLDSFRDYGISDLDDLEKLKGQLFYEAGFSSTSLVKDSSFYNRDFDDTYRKKCNIEMNILVPRGFSEGVPSLVSEKTNNDSQAEFIIDKNSLFMIFDVKTENDTSRIDMALIPKELWDI